MDIKELKEKVSFGNVVSFFGDEIKKEGEWYKTLCCCHEETKPSLAWKEGDQVAYCFGCDETVDHIKYIQHKTGCSFKEAVEILAEIAGEDVKTYDAKQIRKKNKKKEDNMEIFTYEKYCELIHKILTRFDNQEKKQEILKKRNLNISPDCYYLDGKRLEEEIKKWLSQKPQESQQKIMDELIKLKILTKKDYGGKPYTYIHYALKDKLAFPFYDVKGNIVGIISRDPTKGKDDDNKYLCLGNNKYFRKKEFLLGFYDGGLEAAKKEGFLILVEGPFDLWRLREKGYWNVGAVGTSHASPEMIDLIKKEGIKKVLIMFDGDEGGRKGSVKTAELCIKAGIEPWVCMLPEGNDPDDFFAGKENVEIKLDKVDGCEVIKFEAKTEEEKKRSKGEILVREAAQAVLERYGVTKKEGELLLLDKNTHEAVIATTTRGKGMIVEASEDTGKRINPHNVPLVTALLEYWAEQYEEDYFICKTDKIEIDGEVYYYCKDGVYKRTPEGLEKECHEKLYFLYKEKDMRLPIPKPGKEGLKEFLETVSLATVRGKKNFLASLIMCVLPSREKPIFVIQGPTGYGKSEVGNAITSIFGYRGHLGAATKRDYLAIAKTTNGIVIEETSEKQFRKNFVDILNAQTQGQPLTVRKLYTNDEITQITLDPDRTTFILAPYGIQIKNRGDFNSRLVTITLDKGKPGKRLPSEIAIRKREEIVGSLIELAGVLMNNYYVQRKAKLRTAHFCNKEYKNFEADCFVGFKDEKLDELARRVALIELEADDRHTVKKITTKMIEILADMIVEEGEGSSLCKYLPYEWAKEIAAAGSSETFIEMEEEDTDLSYASFSNPELIEALEREIKNKIFHKDNHERKWQIYIQQLKELLKEKYGIECEGLPNFLKSHEKDIEKLGIKFTKKQVRTKVGKRTLYTFTMMPETEEKDDFRPVIRKIRFVKDRQLMNKIMQKLREKYESDEAIAGLNEKELVREVYGILKELGLARTGYETIASEPKMYENKIKDFVGFKILPKAYALLEIA